MKLPDLGWNEFFEEAFLPYANGRMIPARVVVQHRDVSHVVSGKDEHFAKVSGRFRHEVHSHAQFPVVGDWVAIEPEVNCKDATIHAVLKRRTSFSRNAPGKATEEQVIAANLDEIFIVESLTSDLNIRRIERYLALAKQSGATPVILLTKADIATNIKASLATVETVASGAPYYSVSSHAGTGMSRLAKHFKPGRTGVLLGPSGVGKSSLINHLCGEDLQVIQEVRADDEKGRHTTIRRELFRLPTGGLLIDTPGLRELQLWEGIEGISEAFTDIYELATQCRFSNCLHTTEPGCAVLLAVQKGTLDPRRLQSHLKLKAEELQSHQKQQMQAQRQRKDRHKTQTKILKHYKNEKNHP